MLLELANDSEYGLTGAVFTDNPEKIEQAKQQLLCRQPVHQPQVHRSDGRRTSFRWIQHVRHRFEGRRTRLPAPVRASQIDCREGEVDRDILELPRLEGDHTVIALGSIPIDATRGNRKVPSSLLWATCRDRS